MAERVKSVYVERLVGDIQAFLKAHGYRPAKGGVIETPGTQGDPGDLMVSIRLPFSGLCGAFSSDPGSGLKRAYTDNLTSCQVPASPSRKQRP